MSTSNSKASPTIYKDRKFNMNVLQYSKSGNIIRMDGLFAFMFTNIGDMVARINGMVIFPSATPTTQLGDARTIAAHENELYLGTINLSFDPSGGGSNPLVEVVQLFYTDIK